jgi:hypothetical protein
MIMEGTVDGLYASIGQVFDLSERNISLSDYILLHGLSVGDLIILKDDGRDEHSILVGNSTPYVGVTSSSEEGWDFGTYNSWVVKAVYRLTIGKEWLSPKYVRAVAEIMRGAKAAPAPVS